MHKGLTGAGGMRLYMTIDTCSLAPEMVPPHSNLAIQASCHKQNLLRERFLLHESRVQLVPHSRLTMTRKVDKWITYACAMSSTQPYAELAHFSNRESDGIGAVAHGLCLPCADLASF